MHYEYQNYIINSLVDNMAEPHKIPGAHIYEGKKYHGLIPKKALDKVKSFQFRDDDILVATYPKTGWCVKPFIIYSQALKVRSH